MDLAAAAVAASLGALAKTLSLLGKDGPLVLVVMGTARLDNRKFKDVFHQKAHFIKAEDVESLVGHPMGGVCPFALPEGVPVYLDASLKNFDPVYPAAARPITPWKSPWRTWSVSPAASGWTSARRSDGARTACGISSRGC